LRFRWSLLMDFLSAPTLWWLLAGALVIAELMTGTFYMLALAGAAAVAALGAHFGLGTAAQISSAAAVAGLGSGALALWRKGHPADAPAAANPNVQLDVGLTVQVQAWNADGSTQVQHRGSAWGARYAGSGAPQPGPHRIVAVQGNHLQLAPVAQV
jgi:membrane protein implicated in regulation of membrane protease activity